MSTFFGLNISRLGMQAQQKALEVISHNIANASTPGFSRQRAYLSPTAAIPLPGARGMLGSGVRVESVGRIRESYLDMQIRKETHASGYWDSRRYVLGQVEAIFMEPQETGFSSVLNSFFDSWQELSLHPESSPIRSALVQTAGALINSSGHIYEQLKAARADIDQNISLNVDEINALAEQIKDLNMQIMSRQAQNDSPADLMDRRDLLLDRLSELTSFTAVPTDRGSMNIYLGGRALVYENMSFKLAVARSQPNPADSWQPAPKIYWAHDAGQRAADISGGSIKGLLDTREVSLRRYSEDFTSVVWGIVNAVNSIHESGMDLSGMPGEAFFTGDHIETLRVNYNLAQHPDRIAASLPGPVPKPGDGENALKVAQLRYNRISVDVNAPPETRVSLTAGGTTTLEHYYRDAIARLGVDTQESIRMSENQSALLNMMEQRKESVSGVSLDEELAGMVQFQLAYQASARVIASFDEIYDTLINRMLR